MERKRWLLPLFVGFIMFGNHYVRDSLGALEKQFESHLDYTTQEYANLNALYFFPNIITPLLAGMVLDKIGVSRSFLYAVLVASLGHILFALGIQLHSKSVVFLARGLSGSVYEIIDALLPITYLGPLFKSEFQIVVGFMQVFIRLGSVANFIISPILYHEFGLTTAFWFAALVGSSSILLLLGAMNIEKQYVEYLGSLPVKTPEIKSSQEYEMTTIDEENETSSLVSHEKDSISKSSLDDSTTTTTTTTTTTPSMNPIWSFLVTSLPLHKLPLEYYIWLLSGGLTYGAIVPFWFIGSKYIQDYYSQSVLFADTLMTIPEGMVVILGFPLALLSKKYKWNITQSLIGLAIAQLGMCLSLIFLIIPPLISSSTGRGEEDEEVEGVEGEAYNNDHHNDNQDISSNFLLGQLSPVFCLFLLGISFSFSCSFFWGSITNLAPQNLLSQASGVVSCGVNILPTTILPLITFITTALHTPSTIQDLNMNRNESPRVMDCLITTGNVTIISLGGLALLGACCSLVASIVTSKKQLIQQERLGINKECYQQVVTDES